MSVVPYAKAQRIFLVIDNGSAHRGRRSIDRLQGAWPNLIVVHTPIHASWLNEAEIYYPPDDAEPQFDELVAALAEGSKRLRALADAAEEGEQSEAQEATGALVESGRRLPEAETAFRGAVEADYEVKVTLSST